MLKTLKDCDLTVRAPWIPQWTESSSTMS